MTKWVRTLNAGEAFFAAKEGSITVQQLAASVAEALNALAPYSRPDVEELRQELVESFREFALGEGDADDFDDLMDELYDWADTPLSGIGEKACWIQTW